MRIVKMLKTRKYFFVAFVSSVMFAAIYIYTQVLGIVHNLDIWFSIVPFYNVIFLILFAGLFGVTFAYQIYLWKQSKVCSISKKFKGVGTGGAGTFGLFIVAQCPACASLGALFLPLSLIGAFTQFSWLINIGAIFLMLFTLRYLGAFRA